MEFSIKIDTVKSGWSIVYIEGLQDIIYTKKWRLGSAWAFAIFLSLKIGFV